MKSAVKRQLVLGLALAATLPAAWPLTRGTTDLGQAFVSGGITPDEIDALKDEKKQYSLAVLTVARGSGAYLSDVHVTIVDAKQQRVLDTVMDGPWLLVNLPAGRYRVRAALGSVEQEQAVALGAQDHRQANFSFDTHDEVEKPNKADSDAN